MATINRLLGALLVAACVSTPALADTVALNPDHPDRYVVQKGDTLWDISGTFLEHPWHWPRVWRANPQIENPHLIYPGDVIVLDYEGGEPVLRVHRSGKRYGKRYVKLSPRVRSMPLDAGAVPTIPIDAIHQFLHRPRVVTESELEAAPYVVSVGKEHLVGSAGEQVFVRGLDNHPASRYTVLRRGEVYRDPDNRGKVLGYEALHVADGVVEASGDPSTMVLTLSKREVLRGDAVLPVSEDEVVTSFLPREPEQPVKGRIISVVDGVTQIGQHQMIVLNVGRKHGIERGHVMAIYQRGGIVIDDRAKRPPPPEEVKIELDPKKQGGFSEFTGAVDTVVTRTQEYFTYEGEKDVDPFFQDDRYRDNEKLDIVPAFLRNPPGAGVRIAENTLDALRSIYDNTYEERVRLPDKRAGVLMVIRPFEHMSYALVMDASRAIHIHDMVTNP